MKLMYMPSAVFNIGTPSPTADHVLRHVCMALWNHRQNNVRTNPSDFLVQILSMPTLCVTSASGVTSATQNNRLTSYPARGYVHGLLAACYRARWLRRSWQCLTEPNQDGGTPSPRAERQAILDRSLRETNSQIHPRWKSQCPSLDV